jgi:hypothetical protein
MTSTQPQGSLQARLLAKARVARRKAEPFGKPDPLAIAADRRAVGTYGRDHAMAELATAQDCSKRHMNSNDRLRFYMRPARSVLMVSGTAAIVIALTFVIWWSSDEAAESGRQVTTQEAAAAAGAKVLPSEPRLRVEPK